MRTISHWRLLSGLLLLLAGRAQAQITPPAGPATVPAAKPAAAPPAAPDQQPAADSARAARWSLHFQQTVITQWHANFTAPYSADYSLQPREKAKTSLTSTLFIGRRLWRGGQVVFNPELAGGSGLSAARGVAGFPNGETFRIGSADPKLYLARLYLRQVWALGKDEAPAADAPNQLGGPAPTRFLALNVGKFSLADYFDQNSYSHDPRSQFLNWSLMSNGAWDYPANTRGYTVGAVVEYVTPAFALRAATSLVPTEANGPILDKHYGTAHSETLELTRAYHLAGRAGTVRALGFRTVAGMGDYRAAAQRPDRDLTLTRVDGRTKTGFGLSAEQELTDEVGLFGRLSWNDGRRETWAFTEIDRSASLGLSSAGTRWRRPDDRLGLAVVANGLSQPHRAFLASGGHGFIIGDGQLRYAPELIGEAYYSFNLPRQHATISPDYQFVLHPAYNQDRGPVHVLALRLHVAF
ncbi:carbohydrate porin [Hymenobacter persicinus]|uniref:Carbohydrate porin n=1 Tax=Hymenobacter persicinus TaxID=2025506 RepID=A0A4Q5LG61_9BACT|nr:carbohydrate porin [Hymenobacter persicinus]RYU80132.1 carbohydrate porin [Hymenobacter persicinus]